MLLIKYAIHFYFCFKVHSRSYHVGCGLVTIGCNPSQNTYVGIYGPNCVEVWLGEDPLKHGTNR